MANIEKCIEALRVQLERHRRTGLKEYPTRTIFIDPLLQELGWDVRDPDEVDLEHPTIDGKSVDYAMKINQKVVLLLEAKPLGDMLEDVKAITQVVGYAANDGIEWCVLTNGVKYKIYKVSEKANAPEKLLFEVSIDPHDAGGMSVEQIANHIRRLSRDSLAQGVLDELGTEIFTTGKVRKALDRLFVEAPQPLVRLIRKAIGDVSITPSQIQQALGRIRGGRSPGPAHTGGQGGAGPKTGGESPGATAYPESHHIEGKPEEVVELYRALDRMCQDLAPGRIARAYKAKHIDWSLDKAVFCCAHVLQSGLRVWVKTDPNALDASLSFARDVSKIGHWGVGDVELAIDSLQCLRQVDGFIRASLENATRQGT